MWDSSFSSLEDDDDDDNTEPLENTDSAILPSPSSHRHFSDDDLDSTGDSSSDDTLDDDSDGRESDDEFLTDIRNARQREQEQAEKRRMSKSLPNLAGKGSSSHGCKPFV